MQKKNWMRLHVLFNPNDRRWQIFNIFLIVLLFIYFIGIIISLSHEKISHWQTNYLVLAPFFIAFIFWLNILFVDYAIRKAQHRAAYSEAILQNIADGVLVLDQQGSFVYANPVLLEMIPEDELLEVIAQPLRKTIYWKQKVFSVSLSTVSEIGAIAIFRDETLRYEAERARDSLLVTASHELRTPLTAVMNYLEFLQVLIQKGKVNTDDFDAHIVRALENVKRLQSLVSDILDRAQIKAGVLDVHQETFDIRLLLEKAYQLLEILIQEKNLSYELTIESNVPNQIRGDAKRLHQVLVNLLGNAIKFTHQGGIQVHVSMAVKEKLSIQVVDSGVGIDAEYLPNIFEIFQQGGSDVQLQRQGTGLGLSIVKDLVIRMGGEISVSSELGKGSVFTVLLPIDYQA